MISGTKVLQERRTPQRPRGELRVVWLLEAAASVIKEVGYDATTMTEVAKRSGSSIGTIYQYYRDKEAIADALRQKYGEELSEDLGSFADLAPALPVRKMVNQFVQIVTEFTSKHPVLLLLLGVPTAHKEDDAFRRRLQQRLAQLFQAKAKKMPSKEANHVAAVTLQILKCLPALTTQALPSEEKLLREEIETVLTAYLELKLR